MMDKSFAEKCIKKHIDALNKFDINQIYKVASLIIESIENNSTIFWCGNGGSASQANHLSAELIGGMQKEKIAPFKSMCLNTDSAFITAWSNDDKFENIFKRQLEANGNKGDVLIGLSTSGNSLNIIEASKYAKLVGINVISFTGNKGGKLKNHSDININIDSDSTPRIQEIHILIGHIICDLVEQHYKLYDNLKPKFLSTSPFKNIAIKRLSYFFPI